MKVVVLILVSIVLAVAMAVTTTFDSEDQGAANSDLGNSWVATKSASSRDLLFSRSLPNETTDDRRIDGTWRRTGYGLPVKWLTIDHADDYSFYYARVDMFWASLSVAMFLVPIFAFELLVFGLHYLYKYWAMHR